ncbi:glycosyltransferase [Bacillus sp. B-jedd]|uniref:glycosyltransferase n=1 Tax=Bacillus sp. B-jedd TaxID=1476857 RepID=UPI0005156059|nr:glycosyltransferase [Bacillus sp. B-jedd]CEG25511.1 glycosyltransferase [Bacillus sp. B-jedd]
MEKGNKEAMKLKINLETRRKYAGKKRKQGIIISEIEAILTGEFDKPIVFFPALIDWSIPLFQRPQHIAINFAREGVIYFFGTANVYDKVECIEKIEANCYLVNMKEPGAEEAILQLLEKQPNRVIIHLYSGDMIRGYDFVEDCLERGFDILYEHADALSSSITGRPIPGSIIARHQRILSNTDCYAVATADQLYEDILKKREPVRCALVTNGVDFDHFCIKATGEAHQELLNIPKGKEPVIGYFGALADWFDYELMEKLAATKRTWQIVLIGLDYDGSIKKSRLLRYVNVHYLGPLPYEQLPSYAAMFDVSVIPFKINEVTTATSPIKLFEYLAVGKPIVTTAIPECLKYNIAFIARDHGHFIKSVEQALAFKDDEVHKSLLREEARKHTWDKKAKSILDLLST